MTRVDVAEKEIEALKERVAALEKERVEKKVNEGMAKASQKVVTQVGEV